MKSLGKKLIVLSFIFALICSLVIFLYLNSLRKPKETIKKITIIVAAEEIPARTQIDKKMLKEIEVPEDAIFDSYIKKASDIVGNYSKVTILKDEGFNKEKLLEEKGNENELAFNIESKHRAVTVNVSGEAGVANLLKSGDYVDVVVYLPEKKEGQVTIRPDLTKMMLQNAKVLAVDKVLYRTETEEEEGEEEKKMPNTFLVTLSVPVEDIERLVLAEDIGNIELILRPLEKEDNNKTDGAIWQEILIDDTDEVEEEPSKNGDTSKSSDNSSQKDQKFTYYTVKKGDTLRSISNAHYGDPEKYKFIQEFNKLPNKNHIINGEVIKLPTLKE
jgi:pilus assembly protein CpaB